MPQNKTILLVDDSENDIFLMRAAFKKAACGMLLQEVHNGEEAIAYLSGSDPFGDRDKYPLPKLVLLDLNMPKKVGFDVLIWVRAQPLLRRLTIIVLTASSRAADVDRAFDLGATSYLIKPSNLSTLADMVRCLDEWIKINQFPSLSNVQPARPA